SGVSTFTYDTEKGTAVVAAPALAYYNTLPYVSGTAADALALDRTEISIRDLSYPATWWSFAAQDFSLTASSFGAAGGSASWSYDAVDMDGRWSSGHKYLVLARAVDRAGNVQDVFTAGSSSRTFIYDTKVPGITVHTPEDGRIYSALDLSSGTADDLADAGAFFASGEEKVYVRIRDLTQGGKYWNIQSSTWTALVPVSTRTVPVYDLSPALWSISGSSLPAYAGHWESDHEYQVIAYAQDKAGNLNAAFSTTTFSFDATKPQTVISWPLNDGDSFSQVNPLYSFSGTSYDRTAGVAGMQVSLFLDENKNGVFESGAGDRYYDWTAVSAPYFKEVSETAVSTITPNFSLALPANNVSWDVDFDSATWTSGKRYVLRVFASDAVEGRYGGANVEPVVTRTFSIDVDAPVSSVTVPASGAAFSTVNPLPAVQGTAADKDMISAVTKVELQIVNYGPNFQAHGGDDTCWSGPGAGFISCAVQGSTWVTVNYVGTASGTWTYPGVNWESGRKYALYTRATDLAGNVEIPLAGPSFTIDIQAPDVRITQPQNASWVKVFPQIAGTAQDGAMTPADAGIDPGGIKFTLQRLDNGEYWNQVLQSWGAEYLNTAAFVGTTSGTWSLSVSTGGVSGFGYLVVSSGTDRAGNIQNIFTVGESSNSFILDNTPPRTRINAPSDGRYYSALAGISGTGYDYVGVSTVALQVENAGQCYSTATKSFTLACPHWFPAKGSTSSWTFAFLPEPWAPEGQYIVRSSATDLAGNASVVVSSAVFYFDVYQPTVAIVTPVNGGYVNASQNWSTGTVKDFPGADIASVQVALSSSAGAAGSWWTGTADKFSGAAAAAGYAFLGNTTSYIYGAQLSTWGWQRPDNAYMETGRTYTMRVKAVDLAVPPNWKESEFTFTYDAVAATATLTSPSA
ncbi:MAG TPA: hypothetical protein PL037_05060, partial [Elusimicrobiales bacterium]|nr:hypothetical protein [Elusimicrobiales bacterium]